MRRIVSVFIAAGCLFFAFTGFVWSQEDVSIQVKTSPEGVQYLADGEGMTLYYYTRDTQGESICYGNCADAWPVFYAQSLSVSEGLDASDFGTIERNDGTLQTTFKGWPLYYWVRDTEGESVCTGNCIRNWPAFSGNRVTVPSALNVGDFASIVRPDGIVQITFRGYPLYYWIRDEMRGDVTGEGVGQVWYVVDPADFPPIQPKGGM